LACASGKDDAAQVVRRMGHATDGNTTDRRQGLPLTVPRGLGIMLFMETMQRPTTTTRRRETGRKEGLMASITTTCSTCGRNAAEPRIVYRDDAIYEGCVDHAHEPHIAEIDEALDGDYAAWVAQARAAGITGRC
jgi:hypothetical protein